jgi:hypothetical protein
VSIGIWIASATQTVDQAVPDITPISCFAHWCTFEEGFLAVGAAQIILLAGSIVVNRWRDVILVGAVTTLAMFVGTLAVDGWLGLGQNNEQVALNMATVLAVATGVAAAIQIAKRLVVWIFRQIARDPQTFVSAMTK